MVKEGESTKARVMLGRRVPKTRLMDEVDWWIGVVAYGRWEQAVSGYTNTSRNLDRRLLTSQAKDYDCGTSRSQERPTRHQKRQRYLWRTVGDRGKFYTTYVNKKSCSSLAASGRRRSCPSSHAAAGPAPQERTSCNIFPIIIFTAQDTLPFYRVHRD